MEISQYELVVVNLDPTIGSEIRKTRPCVVISPNEMNRNLNTLVIAPLTSSLKTYPTRVSITQPNAKGQVVLDQIRTIDKLRVLKIIGKLSHEEIEAVKSTIRETYVD